MTNSNGSSYNKVVISNHANHLKSHKYGVKELAEMAQRLNAIAYSMGIDKVNKTEVLLSISQWIKEQFGDLSMQEVALAFDLVTAKKIGSDIRHYNSFSKQYIGEVLNAFKDFKIKQLKLFKESEATKQLNEPKPQVSGKEMYEGIKRIALETGKIMKVADWTGAYGYAWKKNLVKRLSEKERQEYKESVIQAMETEKRADFDIEILGDIQSECHKRLLHVHFQEIIDNV